METHCLTLKITLIKVRVISFTTGQYIILTQLFIIVTGFFSIYKFINRDVAIFFFYSMPSLSIEICLWKKNKENLYCIKKKNLNEK